MTEVKQQAAPHIDMATEAIDLASEDIEIHVTITGVHEQKRDDPFLVAFDSPHDADK